MTMTASTSAQQPGIFETMDSETAILILQLQLSDLDTLQELNRGKQREGQSSDLEIAANIWKENLECVQVVITDRRMTESIAAAVQFDGHLVEQATREEQTARHDRVLAQQFLGGNVVPEPDVQDDNLRDTILSKLAGLYVSEEAGSNWHTENYNGKLNAEVGELLDDAGEQALEESSKWASARRNIGIKGLNRSCVACQDGKKYFDVIAAPCSHEYCRKCLQDLFAAAMTDESLFPPRCCRQPITIATVGIFLTKDLKETYEAKKVEFGTPNKTYCSSKACSAFLTADQIEGDNGTCPECSTSTCVICKSATHDGDCPQDAALQALLDIAGENNWQRCFSCRRMVELELGCNHMTCRCGAEFCYICGAQWKTCSCVQWNEDRLLARANVVVQRDAPRLVADNPVRLQQVEEAVEMLRNRHNCAHTAWNYVRGAHQCEECYHQLPHYIFECRQCRIQACNRCRRNRL